ncbi:MAG: hypothetical protein Q8R65_04375 [Polynucleobacter sp.]|nr:hypothetical protein [Polynucleobacter sp.]MDZ4056358.1 hypothetical protein [Polynucleobacter sp.]
MKTMSLQIAALTTALLASSALVQAQPASPAKPKVEAAAMMDTVYDLYEGDVVKIDAKTRTVTFKNKDGESSFVAGPEIKNFAQIKVGDHLSVTYELAVALELIKTKSDGIRTKQEASAVSTAQPGQKPSQTITNATEIIADVVAVDRVKKTASIKGPNGKVTVVKVKNPDLLKDIAVGDVVKALFIDRMAASITAKK